MAVGIEERCPVCNAKMLRQGTTIYCRIPHYYRQPEMVDSKYPLDLEVVEHRRDMR